MCIGYVKDSADCVCMRIDEARCDDQSGCVDDSIGACVSQGTDCGDTFTLNANVRIKPGITRAVDALPMFDADTVEAALQAVTD